MYYNNILELIGKTPLVKINNLTKNIKPTVLAKIEFSNPGGSVKDRVGLAMIEDAERKGLLKTGYTIVEATSGNTGIGLALAGRVKGYRVILVMTDKIGQEKRNYLKALGAEVVIVPKEAPPDSSDYYRNKAKSLSEEIPNAINLNQYENISNPLCHYYGTGAEIWEETNGKITQFVCGVGTAGTITGVSKYLKDKNPYIRVTGADPVGSNFKIFKESGRIGETKLHQIEGLGTDIIPPITDFSFVDEIVSVKDIDSINMCKRLAMEEGIFCGASSGTAAVEEAARCFNGESDGYIYTRLGNPTIKVLENIISDLEKGFGGIATSSGMGAVNTVYMGLLKKGDHIISSDAVYGPSRVVMEEYYSGFGIESSYVNTSNVENIIKAIKPNTKVLYLETPANPTIEISDLEACAKIAKDNNLIMVVDNTFSSPYLQRPLEFGADIVLHSLTKFINGHADIVGGVVVAKEEYLYKKLRSTMINLGCNMDPHQAYFVIRGIKTLGIRIEKAQANAIIISEFLENHEKVEWIKYPGLKSHPQHQLAKKQMDGFGSMISFGLKGGFEAGKTLMNNVKLAMLAVSLGGVESLIEHPTSMTHSKVSAKDKIKAGITDGLVRYSVGIEDVKDLISNLEQAFTKI